MKRLDMESGRKFSYSSDIADLEKYYQQQYDLIKKGNMKKLLELFDGLFSSVPLFLLSCNTDEEAAQVAYNAANKE